MPLKIARTIALKCMFPMQVELNSFFEKLEDSNAMFSFVFLQLAQSSHQANGWKISLTLDWTSECGTRTASLDAKVSFIIATVFN